ncbi:MAG: type II secretion system protein [Bacilli bacterium]
MNKKGFTLIELIMVIVIIAILLLFLVPNIFTFINKNNIKSCESLEKNIISAAKIYVTNNKYDLGFDCSKTPKTITLQTLVDSGDLSAPIINPVADDNPETTKKENEVSLENKVEVTYDCDSKTFTYTFNLNCTENS